MSGYKIELDRYYITHNDEPYEVWVARTPAEAYDDVYGKSPGDALRAMRREFDAQFPEARGNWEPEMSVHDVLDGGGELVGTPSWVRTRSDTGDDA